MKSNSSPILFSVMTVESLTNGRKKGILFENETRGWQRMKSERIRLQKLYNTRDLGGMKTADGRTIKKNCLIRSGQLYAATVEDIETLRSCGVMQILDLRTAQEKKEKPDPQISGAGYVHMPILTDMMQGITREEAADKQILSQEEMFAGIGENPELMIKYMTKVYQLFVMDEHAIAQYARFLNLILENESGATLWHCVGGKDRAGFGAVLVQECLGVSREDIMEDYLFTNECLKTESDQMFASMKAQYHITSDEEAAKLEKVVQAIHAAKEEYLNGIYQTVEETHGNFKTFLEKALGMGEDKIAKMRERFLV